MSPKKHYKFPNLNLVRSLVIMYACSAIHLGSRPMPRFAFKFIRISVNGKHFIPFRGENSVFKFMRISVDGALQCKPWRMLSSCLDNVRKIAVFPREAVECVTVDIEKWQQLLKFSEICLLNSHRSTIVLDQLACENSLRHCINFF